MPHARHLVVGAIAAIMVAAGAAHGLSGFLTSKTIENEDVHDAHLRGVTILQSTVTNSLVEKATVRDTTLHGVTVRMATLHDSHLTHAMVSQATLHGGTVAHASLLAVTFHDVQLSHVHLEKALVVGGSIHHASVDLATLENVDLENVSLCNVFIRETMTPVNTGCPPREGPPPEQPPAQPEPAEWPNEGSHVHYVAIDTGAIFQPNTIAFVNLTSQDGSWAGTCVLITEFIRTHERDREPEREEMDVAFDPLVGPTGVEPGDEASAEMMRTCQPFDGSTLPVEGPVPYEATREGEPVMTLAWHAERPDFGDPVSEEHWWDAETGLVLEWDYCAQNSGCRTGHLADTDAPLGA